ncbi:MAG: hypothetical protein KGO96_08775 [Elusimicrobia bacterium]|nr:hypothetical protein [Elusimicrobiota bacterium]MDE2425983.1 hypothetical protein [Elusimicrobiota bacterium]
MPSWLSHSWKVLTLFLIPVGGGIPAGVLLARHYALPWPATTALYWLSDVILACLFEPLLKLMVVAGRHVALLGRLAQGLREAVRRTTALYGESNGPLGLILVAFGVDPMTGRAAAAAAGHGFLSGWTLSITGDMLYFFVIMASTLWLSSILGNGTVATTTILVVMTLVPPLLDRWRRRRRLVSS